MVTTKKIRGNNGLIQRFIEGINRRILEILFVYQGVNYIDNLSVQVSLTS